MTIKTFTTFILLAASCLLFTACDSKVENNAADEQSPTVQVDTTTGDGGATGSGSADNNATTETNTTTTVATGGSNDDNSTTTPIIALKSLILTADKTSLNKDENTTVKVMASYSDNTTKEVTDTVEWILSSSDTVKITGATLKVFQDKATTLKAKLNNTLSNEISLDIVWIVNGHTLPPEPDKATNDSTLLGIDVNDNGVRDDVERWIYERFVKDTDYPKTKVAIAMQYAKAYQFIMVNDPKNAFDNKSYEKEDYALDCLGYVIDIGIRKNNLRGVDITKHILNHDIYDNEFREKIWNTKVRMKAYFYYNSSLSGHILGGGGGVLSSTKDKCNFDIDSLGEL